MPSWSRSFSGCGPARSWASPNNWSSPHRFWLQGQRTARCDLEVQVFQRHGGVVGPVVSDRADPPSVSGTPILIVVEAVPDQHEREFGHDHPVLQIPGAGGLVAGHFYLRMGDAMLGDHGRPER